MLLILHKLLCRLLCKIVKIPMVIVKPHKLDMFHGIFLALYYVFTSMLIFTFKVCWKTPCGEAFYFVETIQLIRGTNQVSSFCLVWVSTVMNIRADYRFCCFNINKLSRYVIFRKGSCSTDLLLRCRLVSISGWGEIGCIINRIASNFIFCSYVRVSEFLLIITYLY